MPKFQHGVGRNCTVLSLSVQLLGTKHCNHANWYDARHSTMTLYDLGPKKVYGKRCKFYIFESKDCFDDIMHTVKKHMKVIWDSSVDFFFL